MSGKVLISASSVSTTLLGTDVILHRHTWYGHVKPAHGSVLLGHVRRAMTDPCEIAESKTVPGAYLLLNHDVALPDGENALRVPVMADPQTATSIVTTAYYSDAATHGNVVWKRGDA